MLLLIVFSVVFNLFIGTEASCKIPLSPEHGNVNILGGSQVGSIALYSCNVGLKLSGSPHSSCLVSGEWTFPPPKCVNRFCRAPKHPENGMVTYTTLHEKSELTFVCNNGYHLQDTNSVYCTSDGEWSRADVKCVAKTCDVPNHPQHGQVSFESLTFGSQLTFKCDDGYLLKSNEPVLCTSDSTWSKTDVQCVAKACDRPEHPENGRVIFTSLNFGSQLKFKCNDGYILKPNKPVVCTSDGTWNSTDVRCVVKNVCGPPPKVEGTLEPHLDEPEAAIGTSITYRCEFGYVNQDSKNVQSICQWDTDLQKAIWTKPEVVCIPRSCGEPGFVPNAHRIGNFFTFPNKVEFQCQEGYKLKGPGVRYCQANGAWSGRLPKCDHSVCKTPRDPENGMVTYTTLHEGSELTFECENGYHLQNTRPVYCTSDGEWSEADVKCVAITCDLPNHPKNGQVIFDTLTFRSRLKFKCDNGYLLKSDEPVFCTSEGTWSKTDVQCVAKACERPENPENGQVTFTSLNFGSELKFKCEDGYLLKPNEPVFCTSDGTWNNSNVRCVARSCGEPGFVPNAHRIGNFFTFPNKVEFQCQEGYKLTGPAVRYCQANGAWSGRLPKCDRMVFPNCSCTYNSHDRRLSAEVNGLGLWNGDKVKKHDKLTLRCYDPAKHLVLSNATSISGTLTLTCDDCRIWEDSDLPSCEDVGPEGSCEMPLAPKNGDVHIVGTPKVGTVAVYSCKEGKTMVGPSVTKCLITGEWTFPPPKCLSPCVLSAIPNGGVGHMETRRVSRYKTEERFVEFQVGKIFKDEETTIFRCSDGFEPVENSQPSEDRRRSGEVVTCKDGQWSKLLECKPESCYGDPPPMDNGYPVVHRGLHGIHIYYRCNKYYVKTGERGNVNCSYGQWTGHTPTCIDGRCYTSQLNHPGLEKPPMDFIEHEKDYPATCIKGFKANNQWKTISCNAGKWNVFDIICTKEICADEPPKIPNGKYFIQSRDYNSEVVYECDPGYEMREASTVQCLQGQWTGQPPNCNRAICADEPPKIPNGKYFIQSREYNSELVYECDPGYEMREASSVQCLQGQWTGQPPNCDRESCKGDPPHMDNGYPVVNNRSHGYFIYYSCNKYYIKSGKKGDVKCSYGKWTGNTPTCIDGRCYTSQLNHPGLEKPPKDFIENGKDYPATCMNGFKANNQWKTISCIAGKWNVDIICSKEICADEPPKIPNGKYFIQSRDSNSEVVYECDPGYEEREASSVQCLQGQWTGQPPNCDRVTCKAEPPEVENGRIEKMDRKHGGIVSYECLPSFIKVTAGHVNCSMGEWKGMPPTCNDVQSEDCFCTFNPGSQQLAPFVNGSTLENSDPIKKGDSTVLSCGDHSLQLLWPNGTRTFGNAFMVCKECQEWGSNILPSCEPIHPGGENTTTTTASPRQPENCFCRFQSRSTSLRAVVNEENLEYGGRVKKGDGAMLSCRYENQHLFWPNGMRTLDAYMICEVCQEWRSNDLPYCHRTEPGDPFIILNRNVKVQPGGAVESRRGRNLEIECISWNTVYPEWKTPVSLPLTYGVVDMKEQHKVFQTFIHIQSFELWHVGSYECSAIYPSHPPYYLRSTKLDLITNCYGEPNQILHGRYNFQSRSPSSQVEYVCDDGYEMRGHSTVQCFRGEWSGVSPECVGANYAASVPEQEVTSTFPFSNLPVNPTTTKEPNSDERDNCSCTYNNPNRNISAMYFRQRLRYGDKVQKDHYTQLKCLDQAMHLILPNGTRSINGTVRLTCIMCETWEVDQLPTCEVSYRPGILVPVEVEPNPSASEKLHSEKECGCTFPGDWGLKALLNGKRIWRGDYIKIGKSIRLECVKEGHRLVQPNGTMSESITWTCNRCGGASEMPTCEKVQLPEPEVHCPPIHETSAFSVQFTNGRKLNSSVHFRCKEANFKIVGGSDIRICQHSGQWSGAVPYCEAVTCPEIEKTEGITVIYSNERRVYSAATFSCTAPFERIGLSTLHCLHTGKWNNIQPICQTRGCLLGDFTETAPINLLPSMEGVTQELQPVGSELSMHCEEGFVLIENKKATCGTDGKWNVGKAKCVVGCQLNIKDESVAPFITPFITPYKDYYRFGESVTVSCPKSLELTSDVERLQCMGQEWSHTIPNCKEKNKINVFLKE